MDHAGHAQVLDIGGAAGQFGRYVARGSDLPMTL
jgi:hypothetical protein